MIGGFYNQDNLPICGWREEEIKGDAPQRPNNYCKDINGKVILNIYKPKLNELLEKIKGDIVKNITGIEVFLKKIKEDIMNLESAKRKIIESVYRHHNIFDVFNIYQYNIIISKETTSQEDIQKIMEKKLQIANHEVIDELLKEPILLEFLKDNTKDLKYFADIVNNTEDLKKQVPVLEAFIRKYYNDDKWSKNCVDKDELDKILENIPKNKYIEELKKYFNEANLKPYLEDYNCLIPVDNTYPDIFKHLIGNNFRIYIDDIILEKGKQKITYYELYTHTANRDSHIYTNYMLYDYLESVGDIMPVKIKPEHKIVSKRVLYPNYIIDDYDYNLNKLSFIVYNSDKILRKLIFALKINTINKINIFLDRYTRNNNSNIILDYNHYTLFDVFIISNKYHIYYHMQQMSQPLFDFSIYTDNYLETNINNKFKEDKFIKYIKKQIDTNSEINSEKYSNEISNFNKITSILGNDYDTNMLVNVYNFLFLSDKNILANNFEALETININLKYNVDQIFNLICLDLYKEILENYYLFKFYNIDRNIKILLNVFYYNSIYKLDKIKNLINYSNQFKYLKNDTKYYDIDDNYNKYSEYQGCDGILISNQGLHEHRTFYRSLFNSGGIKYVPFSYRNFQMTLRHYKSNEDVASNNFDVKENVFACGEILIFNIINLLIYDGNDINPAFLPVTTLPKLKEFYANKKLSNFEDRNIVLTQFIPLLHNIDFVIIDRTPEDWTPVYRFHYVHMNTIKKGSEILPTYLNVCRILAHLFGINIYDATKTKIICEHDILARIFTTFGGNIKNILLENFAFPDHLRGTFKINKYLLLYFGPIELFFSNGHGEMNKAGAVTPNDYITYFRKEELYKQIIINDEDYVFNLLDHQDEKNIEEITRTIYSNIYYAPLFKQNQYYNQIRIINKITDFAILGKIIKIMEYANIEDMIKQFIRGSNSHFRNLQLLSKLFTSFYRNIDYSIIDIGTLEESLISEEMSIFPYLVHQIIKVALSQKVLLKFLLKMKPASIDIILNNRLKDMIKDNQYDGKEIIQYIKLFKPKAFDMNIFCHVIKNLYDKENFITEYLLTGVSIDKQTFMYNKLYFTERIEFHQIFKLIAQFRNTTRISENLEHIRILNESFTLFLRLFKLEMDSDSIIGVIKEYIGEIIRLFPIISKEIIEDERNYCLFKGLIFFKSLDKKKFKGDFMKIVKQDPKAFSSDIGKELLKLFNITVISASAASAHQAKYLKYKRKYLQLKKFM